MNDFILHVSLYFAVLVTLIASISTFLYAIKSSKGKGIQLIIATVFWYMFVVYLSAALEVYNYYLISGVFTRLGISMLCLVWIWDLYKRYKQEKVNTVHAH